MDIIRIIENDDGLALGLCVSKFNVDELIDGLEMTPIELCLCIGSNECLKVLVESGADLDIKLRGYEESLVELATMNRNTDACRLLIEKGADVDEFAIRRAIYNHQLSICIAMLNNGVSFSKPFADGYIPIHLMIECQFWCLIEYLVETQAEIFPQKIHKLFGHNIDIGLCVELANKLRRENFTSHRTRRL